MLSDLKDMLIGLHRRQEVKPGIDKIDEEQSGHSQGHEVQNVIHRMQKDNPTLKGGLEAAALLVGLKYGLARDDHRRQMASGEDETTENQQ